MEEGEEKILTDQKRATLEGQRVCVFQYVCDEDLEDMTLTCIVDVDWGFSRECPFKGRESYCNDYREREIT